jgi:hypothetical protein
MLLSINLEAVNLISDVITTLPVANVDLLMWKPSVFFLCVKQIKNHRYLKSTVGKIMVDVTQL